MRVTGLRVSFLLVMFSGVAQTPIDALIFLHGSPEMSKNAQVLYPGERLFIVQSSDSLDPAIYEPVGCFMSVRRSVRSPT